MIRIPYLPTILMISFLWTLVRVCVGLKQKKVDWKRELELLLVYVCIVVLVRFTFFPFFKVDGKVQPLNLDFAQMFPPRINPVPLVNMLSYETFKEMLINVIGNTAMFIPVGVILPLVYKQLNTHGKAIAAGVGVSLCIEILQLPFFERVSDVNDLLLNSLGYLIGYGIYRLAKRLQKKAAPKA